MRTRAVLAVLTMVLVSVVAGTTSGSAGERLVARGPGECPRRALVESYVKRVDRALRAKEDVWGNASLARPSGPTYKSVRRYLTPLLLARAPAGKALTDSGFHYVAFAQPSAAGGSGTAALHVADGSQIVSHRAGGRALTIGVGRNGRERYGSCLARLTLPRLAAGHLPIMETRYVDSEGARYAQESFAARVPGTASLVSFVRLTGDARGARRDVEIQFTPTATEAETVKHELPARTLETMYVSWLHTPSASRLHVLDRARYEAARESVIRYWEGRLSEGAMIDVPEPRVRDAARNLLIQNLGLTWRYSIGNSYQQFSFPEGIDVAQVMSAFGFSEVASSMLLRSLSTPRSPYPNWRIGQKLVGSALHYRLFRDRAFVDGMTSALRDFVESLERQITTGRRGILDRERYSSDVRDLVFGLHSQAVAWQGLRAMGQVWAEAGHLAAAVRCRRLAARLEVGLRNAVGRSQRKLADGSVFVPVRLLDAEPPYDSLTQTRAGSYWNLVMPYALASGLFAPGRPEANGVARYMLRHGSRLLGLVRAGAYSLYGKTAVYPASGVNPVYGLNVARFLADNDRPDQLVLSLYGQLAAGMSPGTFVSGEGASVAPLSGEYFRSMYLPPNGASNASFLETLRLMLVHETRDLNGAPRGLELAFATPRAWLRPGRDIVVREAPTSFGPVSFSIRSVEDNIRASIEVPSRSRPATLRLRLRLPRDKHISRVTLGGRSFDRVDHETIELSGLTGRLDLVVGVEGP